MIKHGRKGKITSVPESRDAPLRKTNSHIRSVKSLPHNIIMIESMCPYSIAISLLGNHSVTRTAAVLVILSIASLTLSIASLANHPSLIATGGILPDFGGLRGKSSQAKLYPQHLKATLH